MIEVLERCFADRYQGWLPKLKEMVPSLGTKLSENPELFAEVWAHGTKVLGLESRADASRAALAAGADIVPVASGSGSPEPAGVV
jgi:malate dehydrogenase (quinone)